MIRYFLSAGFIFISIFSFSQNYATLYSDKEALFKNSNWQAAEPQLLLCSPLSYIGMKIDSTNNIGDNVLHYHFNTLRNLSETAAECGTHSYKKVPNWTGSKTIIKSNGENIFLTNSGDSIRIKTNTNLNDTWHFYDFPNGDYFEAELTALSMETVLNVSDNIKVITLSLRDNSGNPVAHDFNEKAILLSENYGLVKAYDFSRFPLDTSAFILQGISAPDIGTQNITAREIYDYNVGDEFHIDEVAASIPNYRIAKKERRIVLSKSISLNLDTVTYKVERVLITHNYNWEAQTHDSSAVKDTIFEKIIISEWQDLSMPPLKLSPSFNQTMSPIYCLNTSDYHNRLIKTPTIGIIPENNECFTIVLDNPNPAPEYIEGLGFYYEGYGFSDGNYKRLTYYKKGSETWGTPVDFNLLLSIQYKNKTEIKSIAAPNPFTDFTVLKIDNPGKQTYKLTLMDAYGKVVREYSFDQDELIIHNEGGLKGLYMYKLVNDKNEVGTGKLIIY